MSRILIVDDKEMMRDSVATMLARKGHTVTVAAGSQPALAKLAERTFDALITDLQMPEMDGLALLAEIRRHDEQLPVIFMTAYGTVETAVTALKNGESLTSMDSITQSFIDLPDDTRHTRHHVGHAICVPTDLTRKLKRQRQCTVPHGSGGQIECSQLICV